MFGRNLYDADETNSILEIRLNIYCPLFEEMKSSLLTVADFFKSSCSDTSYFDVGLILYFFLQYISSSSSSSSVICQTTGPKPLPKRFLHIERSRASSFNCQYPLLSLSSSSSFLRLLPRLLVTSILHEIRKRKANWIGHILRRNCLLQQVIEGKIKVQYIYKNKNCMMRTVK